MAFHGAGLRWVDHQCYLTVMDTRWTRLLETLGWGLHGDCRWICCKTPLMGRLWTQLPQSVFGIRSNAVVLFKQHTARACLLFLPGYHVPLTLSCCSPVNWDIFFGKVLKCCPRFPLRRQNKDAEATRSTPRTAHINIFIRRRNLLTWLYWEAVAVILPPSHLPGCDIFPCI